MARCCKNANACILLLQYEIPIKLHTIERNICPWTNSLDTYLKVRHAMERDNANSII